MTDESTYLVFVWTTSGYELREAEGTMPAVGESVETDGKMLFVSKIAPSPLPRDNRACAYLQA
jgi:hypothetical protein